MRHETNYTTGYPMNFLLERKGDSITVTLCHNKEIAIDDEILFGAGSGIPKFRVTEILEHREPAIKTANNPDNKNHHPAGVMFYKVTGIKVD